MPRENSGIGLPAPAWGPVGGVALVLCVVLLATSSGYGYYRDELYFRLLGQHLDWGYADLLGPATPAMTTVATGLFGDSVQALRVPAAVLLGLTVVLVSLLAREFGAARGAQVLAAIATAVSVFPLMVGHVLLTSTLDLPLSLLVILFGARALLSEDGRWWLACGGVLGLALYNKKLILVLALGIVVGLVLAGPRQVFRGPFLWLAAVLAVLVGAPTLLYEFTHGWPMLTTAGGLTTQYGSDNRISFLPQQVLLLGPFLVPVCVAGALVLWRDPRLRAARALAAGFGVCVVIFVITGGRPDYTVPLLLALFAAGSAPAIRWCTRTARRKVALGAGLVLNAVLAVPIALPVLPQEVAGSILADADQILAGQTGWPELAAQTGALYLDLPAAERAHTVAVTANYGQAGALDRFGAPYRLPSVYSGHNQMYWYGPPPADATTVLAVGLEPVFTRAQFLECREHGRIGDAAPSVANDDAGAVIQLCRGPRQPWPLLWSKFHHSA